MGGRFAVSRRHHQRSGKTCIAATAFGCSPIRLIPITSTPNTRAASSGASTGTRTRPATFKPKPNYKEKLRFNWNTPIALSPNEKGTIYIGAQFLFRSRDHGQSWDRISPDLTTNDPEKQKQEQSGGVTVDNSSAEMHTTIYSISESPKEKGLIWVGTDDGNLQLTRDGGKTWNNVVGNVPGLPKNSWVSWVQASNFDAGTAYAAFDRHTFGDMAPYVFQTTDYGRRGRRSLRRRTRKAFAVTRTSSRKTWSNRICFSSAPSSACGFRSTAEGWAQFKGGHFPAVAVRDLAIQPRDNDLVLATHGRGIWIIDDITPLRALTPDLLTQERAFVRRARCSSASRQTADGPMVMPFLSATIRLTPPLSPIISAHGILFGKMKLEVLDSSGRVVDELPASKRPGLNRVIWTMREKPPRVPPAAQIATAGYAARGSCPVNTRCA